MQGEQRGCDPLFQPHGPETRGQARRIDPLAVPEQQEQRSGRDQAPEQGQHPEMHAGRDHHGIRPARRRGFGGNRLNWRVVLQRLPDFLDA